MGGVEPRSATGMPPVPDGPDPVMRLSQAADSVALVLDVRFADRVDPLLAELAAVLAEPLVDPFVTEFVAVPSIGVRQWVVRRLGHHLGAATGRSDGIAANIELPFPGTLVTRVLEAGAVHHAGPGDPDPWPVERLVWSVLAVVRDAPGDPALGPAARPLQGGTWFGRARRLADLLDRYGVHRPDLIRQWAGGADVDEIGAPLPPDLRWQAELWRRVRARLGRPSPAERLPAALAAVRDGTLDPDLPPRLALFGLSTLPTGLLDLLDALAVHRRVHLLVLAPSPGLLDAVRADLAARPVPPRPLARRLLRADDRSDLLAAHPLLRTWGQSLRETTLFLAAAEADGLHLAALDPERAAPASAGPAGSGAGSTGPTTLLQRLQTDIRANRAPSHDLVPPPDDRSIEIHACHGSLRQVEVLRDLLLHLLQDDPTLTEADIVVICPAIDEFAPLIDAVFGDPDAAVTSPAAGDPPRLRVRVTDRSRRDANPVFATLTAVLDVLAGRATVAAVGDLLAQPPVRERFALDDEHLAAIDDWVAEAHVRWGLDASSRARWGLPPDLAANSWRAAVDRLLVGATLPEHETGLGPGDVAPIGIEGDEVAVAGRLAAAVAELTRARDSLSGARPLVQWCHDLADLADRLMAVPTSAQWQRRQLDDLLAGLVADTGDIHVPLELGDVRRLLAERLTGPPPRTSFGTGEMAACSLLPLRSVPHRVVCLLGLDEGALVSGRADGDDLLARAPRVGDPDPRTESRHLLLEAVLAAGEKLLVLRTGRDVRTNADTPIPVVVAELLDAVADTVAPHLVTTVLEQVVTVHPRQGTDLAYFGPDAPGRRGPGRFDRPALLAAQARAGRVPSPTTRLAVPSPLPPPPSAQVVDLADLRAALTHPVQFFFRTRLGLVVDRPAERAAEVIPTALSPLDRAVLGADLLGHRVARADIAPWNRRTRAAGVVPPGVLGDRALEDLDAGVDAVCMAAAGLDAAIAARRRHATDAELIDGTRLVGVVTDCAPAPHPGPVHVRFARWGPRHQLGLWLDLLACTVDEPDQDWCARAVYRGAQRGTAHPVAWRVAGTDRAERHRAAQHALAVVVDLARRAAREPLPLFAATSAALANDGLGAARDAWESDDAGTPVPGEDADPYHRLAFGHLDVDSLLAVPARADDPAGPALGRVERLADWLWTAVRSSIEELAVPPWPDDAGSTS